MNKLMVSALVLIMSVAGQAQAGDAEAGKTKAAVCMGCHGPDGNSMVPTFPKLAGQGEKYIAKQLADFKANTVRQDPTMLGFVVALTDQDMHDIGAFFASQKLASAAATEAPELGREIYKGGLMQKGVPACQACHGANGAGVPTSGYPQVGGQHAPYTLKQLMAFKDGSRSNDAKSLMRDIITKMTNEEIEAVANYIATLK